MKPNIISLKRLCLVASLFAVTSCVRKVPDNQEFNETYMDHSRTIFTDKVTGCEYIWTNGALTPRIANDGQSVRGCILKKVDNQNEKHTPPK